MLVVHRKVHRYCGRRWGGHRLVASSVELPAEDERVLAQRSDLAGDDTGAEVAPYATFFPLASGLVALSRTTYDRDADRTGAVRTETFVLEPASLPECDPFPLLAALRPLGAAESRAELEQARAADRPIALEPRPVELASGEDPARHLEPLAALGEGLLGALLSAAEGQLPLALLGVRDPEPLLRALHRLVPRAGRAEHAFCTGALAPRAFARVVVGQPQAADRFVAQAARDGDLAVLDLGRQEGPRAWNVTAGELAERLARSLAAGGAPAIVGLVERASAVASYRAFADLGLELRWEELTHVAPRSPEEAVELANHLRRRAAPAPEVLACYREALAACGPERLEWASNVLLLGWLPVRAALAELPVDAAEERSVLALARAALASGQHALVERLFHERVERFAPGLLALVVQWAREHASKIAGKLGRELEARVCRELLAARGDAARPSLEAWATLAAGSSPDALAEHVRTLPLDRPELTRKLAALLARAVPRPASAVDADRTGAFARVPGSRVEGSRADASRVSAARTGEHPVVTAADLASDRTGAFPAARPLPEPAPRADASSLALERVEVFARELLPRLVDAPALEAHRHALAAIARAGRRAGVETLARAPRERAVTIALARGDGASVVLRAIRRALSGGFREAAALVRQAHALDSQTFVPSAGYIVATTLATAAAEDRVDAASASDLADTLPEHAWVSAPLRGLVALQLLVGKLPARASLLDAAELALSQDDSGAPAELDLALAAPAPRDGLAAGVLARALTTRVEQKPALANLRWLETAARVASVLARSRVEEAEKLASVAARVVERVELATPEEVERAFVAASGLLTVGRRRAPEVRLAVVRRALAALELARDASLAVLGREARAALEAPGGDAIERALGERLAPLLQAGKLDVAQVATLGAQALRAALVRVQGGFALRVQNGVETLAARAAADGPAARPLLVACIEYLTRLDDRELGARAAQRIRDALKAGPDDKDLRELLSTLETGKTRRNG